MKACRLGKRKIGPSSTSRPLSRPIKIMLKSPEEKSTVLGKAKKLKDYPKYPKLSVFADKTKREQEEYRQLRERCNKLRDDSGEDYIIFRGDCVIRKHIRDIVNKGSSNNSGESPQSSD